jgi:uncharacterized Zn finger protein (UPF0148 family)
MLMPYKRGDVECPKCGYMFEFLPYCRYWKMPFGRGYLYGLCPNCGYEYRMCTKDARQRTEIEQDSTNSDGGVR